MAARVTQNLPRLAPSGAARHVAAVLTVVALAAPQVVHARDLGATPPTYRSTLVVDNEAATASVIDGSTSAPSNTPAVVGDTNTVSTSDNRPANDPPDSDPSFVTPTQLPNDSAPDGGGSVGGPVIDPAQADARRASGELEGARLDSVPTSNLPKRLSPMARAGWGTLIGGATLLAGAGVLAGMAEAQEDQAARLAAGIDPETGKQPQYRDEAQAYEDTIERGQRFGRAAQVLAIVGAASVATSVVLLIVSRRQSKHDENTFVRLGARGMEIRF